MIENLIEIIFVKRIPFKFEYIRINPNRDVYYKNYDVLTPYELKLNNLKGIPFNKSCSILIVKNNKYYWCPMFEEIFKFSKGKLGRKRLIRDSKIYRAATTNTLYVVIKDINTLFKTSDVKPIKIIE
jgi:hypothetical protein